MGRRTLRKTNQRKINQRKTNQRKTNQRRSTIRKTNQRKINQRKTNQRKTTLRKKYVGGDGGDFKSVVLSILNDTYIPFLPTTSAINDKDQCNNYLKCVSAFDLLTIIGNNKKFSNSKSITSIVKEIDSDNTEIFKVLGDLTKLPVSRKVMSKFMINCARLRQNQLLKQLREYILECEDYLSIKYINWYKVVLGLITLDDEFESTILSEIKDRRIFIDTDNFKYGLEILYNDNSVKNMFKKRILDCGHKPQGFFDKLMGTISWDSYNDCFKCSENKCIVYLDENYKSFLHKKHKIRSIDKIKILIYIELRLRLFSKYIALEGLRITKKKFSKVKSILNKIYKDDSNRGKLHNNDTKQFVMGTIFGGGDKQEDLINGQQLDAGLGVELDAPPGAELDAPPNAQLDAPLGAPPGDPASSEPGGQLGDPFGVEPGAPASSEPGAQLGDPFGVEPGAPASSEPGAPASSEPGAPASSEPGAPASSEPGAQLGDPFGVEPGAPASSEPGAPASSEPGAPASGELDAPSGAKPGAEPGAPLGAEPGAPLGAEPGAPLGAEPGAPLGAEPGAPFGAEPGAPLGAEPGAPFGAEPGAPFGAELDAPDSAELATQLGNELGAPPGAEQIAPPGGELGDSTGDNLDTSDSQKKEDKQTISDKNSKEENINSSSIIYLTYSDTKSYDYSEEQIEQLNNQRVMVAKGINRAMKELTGSTSDETFKVYRVRFGPQTTSVEVVINITGDENLTEESIKDKIITSITKKGKDSIQKKLFLAELGILKDIYYDGISRNTQLQSLPAQYKRVMLQMPGIYPISEKDRINFEEKIITSIIEILDGTIEIERIHLERVSRVTNKNDEVVVQFLIMDGTPGSKTSNEILMEFKNNYNLGESKYSNTYRISNVVFGDPSIILDGSDVEIPNTLSEEKELVEEVDKTTLNKLEGEYRRTSYYGCELTLNDLKNNLITSSTPLFNECEGNIYQYFNGYIGTQ